MTDFVQANRELWNEWTPINVDSDYYDLDGFKAGQSALGALERDEVGEVAGKSLLDLQCHFGLGTLSWARLGAVVTGVDISDESIRMAQALSEELDIPARFICSDIYALPQVLDAQFDIVFTSGGVLNWLPDLQRWAEIIFNYLKPGGTFYISEIHPIKRILAPRLRDDQGNPIAIAYFPRAEPVRVEEQGSYAKETESWHTAYYWSHSLGEIVTSLVTAGLQLEFLQEFPSDEYPNFPVAFSIRAVRG